MILAIFTAVSMTLTTAALVVTLMSAPIRRSFNAVAPALDLASLTFGV